MDGVVFSSSLFLLVAIILRHTLGRRNATISAAVIVIVVAGPHFQPCNVGMGNGANFALVSTFHIHTHIVYVLRFFSLAGIFCSHSDVTGHVMPPKCSMRVCAFFVSPSPHTTSECELFVRAVRYCARVCLL